jgi:hypothetical protein
MPLLPPKTSYLHPNCVPNAFSANFRTKDGNLRVDGKMLFDFKRNCMRVDLTFTLLRGTPE